MNKIKQTSSDKVRGKLVRYKLGDCLSVFTSSGNYLAVIMTGKFNKYYNFTLMEYLKEEKPDQNDFINGKIFGTRFGSWEDLVYAVDQIQIECKYIDFNLEIEFIGNFTLISNFDSASYSYRNNIDELYKYYLNEIPIRLLKTANAEKNPELAFVGKHLIETKSIIKQTTIANHV